MLSVKNENLCSINPEPVGSSGVTSSIGPQVQLGLGLVRVKFSYGSIQLQP